MNSVIEEKMIEIAHILGITVEGRIGDLGDFIVRWLSKKMGTPQSIIRKDTKILKGDMELLNMTSSINYEQHGGKEIKL